MADALFSVEEHVGLLSCLSVEVKNNIDRLTIQRLDSMDIHNRSKMAESIDQYKDRARVIGRMLQRETRIFQRLQDQQKIFDLEQSTKG